jgi:hypothetical protein
MDPIRKWNLDMDIYMKWSSKLGGLSDAAISALVPEVVFELQQ